MNLLKEFGLDPEDVDWKDLASCKNTDPQYFDKLYQDKPALRPVVDDICISCPVFKECGISAVKNKESFVWAATWFENGVPVPEMSEHKTPEFKKMALERLRE